MKRVEVIREIANSSWGKKSLIVSNLGYASRELFSVSDRPSHFYMLGSMGLASSLGLGLSLTQGRHVIVLDGDGSVLMNLGSLATVANSGPKNLHLVIIDNQAHGSTGGQPSPTATRTDLAAIARGAGIREVVVANSRKRLRKIFMGLDPPPRVTVAQCEQSNADVHVILLSARLIKERFMKFVGGRGLKSGRPTSPSRVSGSVGAQDVPS